MLSSTEASIRINVKNELGLLAAADPGSLTVRLYRNGVFIEEVDVASTTPAGQYIVTWTNGSWNDGDTLQLEVVVVDGSSVFRDFVWYGEINDQTALKEQLAIVLGKLHS
jgi:hypothetical protein